MMVIHELKTWPEPFAAVRDGDKTFEIRRNDREFNVGDTLRLKEWIPDALDACRWDAKGLTGTYTGKSIDVAVTFIIVGQYGLPADLAVMSIRLPDDICNNPLFNPYSG